MQRKNPLEWVIPTTVQIRRPEICGIGKLFTEPGALFQLSFPVLFLSTVLRSGFSFPSSGGTLTGHTQAKRDWEGTTELKRLSSNLLKNVPSNASSATLDTYLFSNDR